MSTAQAKTTQSLVDAIVIGTKPFFGIDHSDGRRIVAQPGDQIQVTFQQIKTFPERLVVASVAEAMQASRNAQDAATAELARLEAAALAPTPVVKPAVPVITSPSSLPAKAAEGN